MDGMFKTYIDNGTTKLINLLSATSVEEEERKAIIKDYVSALRNNVVLGSGLTNSEQLIDTISINYVDRRISEYLGIPKITSVQCDKAIEICGRLKVLIDGFGINGWPLPALKNSDPERIIANFEEKKAGISIQDRVVEIDGEITNIVSQARAEYSISLCDSAIASVEELKKQIEECKSKGVKVPHITNSDPDKCIKDILSIKGTAQKKAEVISKIFENDMQIDALMASNPHMIPDKWETISQLCGAQKQLFDVCKSNKWNKPEVKNNQLDKIENQISTYHGMISLDAAISAVAVDLSNKQNYISFINSCNNQVDNINKCKNNGWGIPVLKNTDPHAIAETARKQNERIERAKAVKRTLYLLAASVIVIFVLVVFCIFKYRQGKVQIPFDSDWAAGRDLHKIVDEFDDAGFEEIELVADTSGWGQSDTVLSVTIDGRSQYSEGKYIKPDVRVVITYISSDRIAVEGYLEGWRDDNAYELASTLEAAGFSNVVVKEVYSTTKTDDEKIKDIMLNNELSPYVDGECYLPNNASIVISYYKYMISMFSSADGLIGKGHEEVMNDFVNAGFTNVDVDDVQHYENWYPGGTVVNVVIDGNKEYTEGDLIDPDASIKIYYNSFLGRIDITDILSAYSTKTWTTIRDQLENKGLTELEFVPVITDDPSENLHVRTIEIFGKLFPGGDCSVESTAPIKISYSFLRIGMSQASSYYVGNNTLNYHDVEQEFKNMGFGTVILRRSDDLTTGWVNNEGTIKSITIGDSTSFNSGDTFDFDQRVTIVVYTFKGRGCEDISLPEQ